MKIKKSQKNNYIKPTITSVDFKYVDIIFASGCGHVGCPEITTSNDAFDDIS